MTGSRIALTALLAVGLIGVGSASGEAQSGPPLSKARPDCQTLLRCNFSRNGVYRGCISAYTCRRCRLVRARNCGTASQGRRTCRRLVCSWG